MNDICNESIIYYYWVDTDNVKYCKNCYLLFKLKKCKLYCYEIILNGKDIKIKCDTCKGNVYNTNVHIYSNEEYDDSDDNSY